jgi:hypothetical protein
LIRIADFIAPMAWCRSNRSAAHAIGVFIPHTTGTKMMKKTSVGVPNSGTMIGPNDADRIAGAARAQMELIESLARLVLALIEREQHGGGRTKNTSLRSAARGSGAASAD